MNEDPFDKQFDAAFEEAVQNREWLPDPDESWRKVEARLSRKRKRRNRLRRLPYAAASFLLGAVIFGTPAATKAFTPLYQSIKNIQEGAVHVVFGTKVEQEGIPLTSPPPSGNPVASVVPGEDVDSGETVQKEYPSWAEASASFPYPLPLMPQVPEGFQLDRVMVIFPHGDTGKGGTTAVFFYSGPSSKIVTVTFRKLEEGEKLSSDYREADGTFQSTQIKGNEAYLFWTKDGSSSLEMLAGGLYVSFVGNVEKETILRMAGSTE
ncbi:DUF4367 domain-containing protein [Gorillibacterium timonense]|uniref:DUF4367 domain-containing protein n=1 Tax=Gorillibacterium timonense TaxID=1689269 RepID=UPI00071DB5FA|nr:DUF4367 domain-containing protein [Gorillibacterium timonense]